jgi:hypothetical protein
LLSLISQRIKLRVRIVMKILVTLKIVQP